MSQVPDDRCGYTWPEDHEVGNTAEHQSCCWRKTVEDVDRCIWHADSDEIEKSPEALERSRAPPEIREQNSPHTELLDGADLRDTNIGNSLDLYRVSLRKSHLSDANLRGADLDFSNLQGADLSRTTLIQTNLEGANMRNTLLDETTLTGADIHRSDLSWSSIRDGNLSEVNSGYTMLQGSDLSNIDFTDANLHHADLSNSDASNATFNDTTLFQANFNTADLRGADFKRAEAKLSKFEDTNLSNADFAQADLSKSIFNGANLSGANLAGENLFDKRVDTAENFERDVKEGDFSGPKLVDTSFKNANLSSANLDIDYITALLHNDKISLRGANLSGQDFSNKNLSDQNFLGVTLSGATFYNTDLSGTNLGGADLTNADLREINIEDVAIDGSTTCKYLNEKSRDWDSIARAYHDLKTTFTDHGLIGKARRMYVRERRARSLELKTSDGQLSLTYLSSLPSRIFTGYGVQVRNLITWMLLLFTFSTLIFQNYEVMETFLGNISYSVLAFTVAPPKIPVGTVPRVTMLFETFFGTLSIVLIGYILGNRERF